MKVKKFICTRCFAPKVTKIETAYVICDYCASLMDVDSTIGFKEFYADKDKVIQYEQNKHKLEADANEAFNKGNKANYLHSRNLFWTMYLDTYPEYILPTVSPKLLEEWCTLCAKIDTYHAFKENATEETNNQYEANNEITYYTIGDSQFAEWKSFMNATKMYHKSLMHNLKEMREVPEFNLLNTVLPLDIAIKKEMSMYAQMWIPYLEEKYHEQLLDFIGLKTEYIDIPPVKIKEKPCANCNKNIQVPDGAIVSKCSNCNTDNVWTKVACSGCSAENELPEDWQETITCVYCTLEIRVVNKLFG